jgi:hypothetical protein
LGAGLTLGGQAIFGNKEKAKDPEVQGEVTYGERAGNAIDQVVLSGAGSTGQTETPPIQGDSID